MSFRVEDQQQGGGMGGAALPLQYQYAPDKTGTDTSTSRRATDIYYRVRVQNLGSWSDWFPLDSHENVIRVRNGNFPDVNSGNLSTYENIIALDDDGNSYQVQIIPQHETAPQGDWNDFTSSTFDGVVEHLPTPSAAIVGRNVYSMSFHAFHVGFQNSHNNRFEWERTTPGAVVASNVTWLGELGTEEEALSRITLHSSSNTYAFVDTTERIIKTLDNSTYVAGTTIATRYAWVRTGAQEYEAIGELLEQVPSHVNIDPPDRPSLPVAENYEYLVPNSIRNDIERFRGAANSHVSLRFRANLQRFGGGLTGNCTIKLFAGTTELGGITAAGGSIGTSSTPFTATIDIDSATTIPDNQQWKIVYDNNVSPANNAISFTGVRVDINFIYASESAVLNALKNATSIPNADKSTIRDNLSAEGQGLRPLIPFSRVFEGASFSLQSTGPNVTAVRNIPASEIQAIQAFKNATGRNVRVVQRVAIVISSAVTSARLTIGIRQGGTNKAALVNTLLQNIPANTPTHLLIDTSDVDFSGTDNNWQFFMVFLAANPGGTFTFSASPRAEVIDNTQLSPVRLIEALDDTFPIPVNDTALERVRNNLKIPAPSAGSGDSWDFPNSIASVPGSPVAGQVIAFRSAITTGIPATFLDTDGTTVITAIAVGDIFERVGTNWVKRISGSLMTMTQIPTGVWTRAATLPASGTDGNYFEFSADQTAVSWFEDDGTTVKTGAEKGDIAFRSDSKWIFVGNRLSGGGGSGGRGNRAYTVLFAKAATTPATNFAQGNFEDSITLTTAPTAGKRMQVRLFGVSNRLIASLEFDVDDYLSGEARTTGSGTAFGTSNVMSFVMPAGSGQNSANASARAMFSLVRGNTNGTLMRFATHSNAFDNMSVEVREFDYPAGGGSGGDGQVQADSGGPWLNENAVGSNTSELTFTPTPVVESYIDDLKYVFQAQHDYVAGLTINLSSLGAKAVVRHDGSALETGDIVDGQVVAVRFDLTNDRWVAVNVGDDAPDVSHFAILFTRSATQPTLTAANLSIDSGGALVLPTGYGFNQIPTGTENAWSITVSWTGTDADTITLGGFAPVGDHQYRRPHDLLWDFGNPVPDSRVNIDGVAITNYAGGLTITIGALFRLPDGNLYSANGSMISPAQVDYSQWTFVSGFQNIPNVYPCIKLGNAHNDARLRIELPADFDFQNWRLELNLRATKGNANSANGFAIGVGSNLPNMSDNSLGGYNRGLLLWQHTWHSGSPVVVIREADGTENAITRSEGSLEIQGDLTAYHGSTSQEVYFHDNADAGYSWDFDEDNYILTMEFREDTLYYYWNFDRMNLPFARFKYQYDAANNPMLPANNPNRNLILHYIAHGVGDNSYVRLFKMRMRELYRSERAA